MINGKQFKKIVLNQIEVYMGLLSFLMFWKKKRGKADRDYYAESFGDRERLGTKFRKLFGGKTLDNSSYAELEDQLVKADIGPVIASELIERLKTSNVSNIENAIDGLKVSLLSGISAGAPVFEEGKLSVVMVLGVNGVGKTTSIAKLANYYKNMGKKMIIAAADTFRAAAIEQLSTWAKRVDIPVVRQHDGADAASVVFDALESAISKKVDLLIIDTAGRLHNKQGLMDELKKIDRVINSKAGDRVIKTNILVIDANTGQNGFHQAETFNSSVGVNGIILTKYDAKGKGGIVFNISRKLKIPFYFIGTGEKIEDFKVFDREDFVNNIFE